MIHVLLAVIYMAFISLGLPDALLGSSWPTIYQEWNVPVSWAGIISLIISAGTVIASLMSNWLTRKWGAGKVTAFSVATTAVALWGFSVSSSFWMLCLWAVPYGLGAGCVDAALNHYVAVHYASRHMSWLHCMWGLGASIGPYILAWVLSGGGRWENGYRTIAYIQIVLTAVLFLSLPLWKDRKSVKSKQQPPVTMMQALRLPGAKDVLAGFYCYCGMETTAALWAASYLVLELGVPEAEAAGYGSLFYVGITTGRAISGFVTMKLSDRQMIRLGAAIVILGILAVQLVPGVTVTLAGLLLIGLGCAPIYPCTIHSTPGYFGADNSQALIGMQMASAYVGTALMPPLFGVVAQYVSASLYPAYLLVLTAGVVIFHERLVHRVDK
ncbi:MAG: MFS transporter [Ruminococcaceae bacterium]|nr:MFS transporter [Oscillospiraceae bacterium]